MRQETFAPQIAVRPPTVETYLTLCQFTPHHPGGKLTEASAAQRTARRRRPVERPVVPFRTLPVTNALRRSLARLFAARCVPNRWTSHHSSRYFWLPLQAFTAYLATLDAPVADLDQLTAGVWQQWRLSRRPNRASPPHRSAGGDGR
jgi:hypothetical protein